MHLSIEHVELRAGAGIESRFGETLGFLRLLDGFFRGLDQLAILLQIRVGLLHFQLDLSHVVVVGDLRFFEQRPLLFVIPVSGAAVPQRPGAL